MLGSGILVAALVALCAAPLSAQADATGKCMWYNADIPPSTGTGTVPFQDCGLHSAQTPEATYYWSDEARVIYEPRTMAFDYSAFGGLDPFATEYSIRKANELFPDTSRVTDAVAKAQYVQNGMTAKARTLETRGEVANRDACIVVPTRYTDVELSNPALPGWLPPVPAPDGDVGTYTYALASNLTPEQRAVILAGLATFDEARAGSQQPKLVEWTSGSEHPPVITFQNAVDGFDGAYHGMAQAVTLDEGRDGFRRWVNGNVTLSPVKGFWSEWTVVHEILHVYGFRHNPVSTESEVMSRVSGAGGEYNIWELNEQQMPVSHGKVDSCTKEGIQNATAPK